MADFLLLITLYIRTHSIFELDNKRVRSNKLLAHYSWDGGKVHCVSIYLIMYYDRCFCFTWQEFSIKFCIINSGVSLLRCLGYSTI